MARLPTLDDLGARPTPVSRRSIASNPQAGAVGQALSGLGGAIEQTGQKLIEKQDRLAYASAKSTLLEADISARKELENDPDYETWEPRYNEKMKTARETAAKMIGSRSDRSLFEQDANIDIMRGAGELAKGAYARRVDVSIADTKDQLAQLQDVAQNAPDDASREAVIGNASEMIAGLRQKGYISAEAAGNLRRDWTQNYLVQRIETLRTMGDLAGANDLFEGSKPRLEASVQIRLAEQLHDAIENRDNLIVAEDVVHGGSPLASLPKNTPAAAVADVSKMIAITASSESGNRERDSAGRLITSPVGAQGRMQVMPATARDPGHGIRPWDGKTDEDRSRVGSELLGALMKKYSGDPAKAWAAYNWGEKRVDKAVSRYGDKWLDYAPDETRSYVRKNVVALGGATQIPEEHDLNQIYSKIDARAEQEGWTPERREAVKSQAAKLVDRDEGLLKRDRSAAYEGVLGKIDALGDNFTNVSQLGDAYYRMAPDDKIRVKSIAAANAKPVEAKANGDVVRALHIMAIDAPEVFAGADLRPYRSFMTPGEFDEVTTSQAKAKENAGAWSPRVGVQTAITWGEKFGGVALKDDEDRYKVYRYMDGRARQFHGETKGKTPTEDDYQRWFREATAETKVSKSFLGIDALRPDSTTRAYDAPTPTSAYRKQIIRTFKTINGRDPTEPEILAWYARMGEAIK